MGDEYGDEEEKKCKNKDGGCEQEKQKKLQYLQKPTKKATKIILDEGCCRDVMIQECYDHISEVKQMVMHLTDGNQQSSTLQQKQLERDNNIQLGHGYKSALISAAALERASTS